MGCWLPCKYLAGTFERLNLSQGDLWSRGTWGANVQRGSPSEREQAKAWGARESREDKREGEGKRRRIVYLLERWELKFTMGA